MARFFYAGRELDIPLTWDFILRTYGSVETLLRMPWREGLDVVRAGAERSRRSEYWMLYCTMYPNMTEDNFIQFSDWYEDLTRPRHADTNANVGDIMTNVEHILSMNI